MIITTHYLDGLVKVERHIGDKFVMVKIGELLTLGRDSGVYEQGGQGWWFKLLGLGIQIDYPAPRPYYSERHGYRKALRLGRLRIMPLKSWKGW